MVSYTAATFAGLVAIVAAQSPTGSLPASAASSCQSTYTQCLSGYNANAATCQTALTTCQATCQTSYDACRVAPNANMATCTAALASCRGSLPSNVNNNGTASGTNGGNNYVTVTDVVASYTTYCPYATTFTAGGQAYTVTGPSTVTVTNCPCTLTRTVPASSATGTAATGTAGNNAATTPAGTTAAKATGNSTTSSTPAKFTGGAAQVVGASLSVFAAGAAVLAFAL